MGQKLCAFYQKCGAFWVKKIVRFFVLFLAKVGAPLSSKLLKTLPTFGQFYELRTYGTYILSNILMVNM